MMDDHYLRGMRARSVASVFGLGIMSSTMAFHQTSPLIIHRCWRLKSLQMKPRLRIRNSQYNESTHGDSVGVKTCAKMLDVSKEEEKNSTAMFCDTSSCRIVATSDGKISPSSVASLSRSSKSVLDKIQLIYAVESQKQLRDLTYMTRQSTFESMRNTREAMDGTCHVGQEDNLISILKQALHDGGYKLMNRRDLDLCSALNAGYLLRLSLLPDIKELDPCIGRKFYPEMYEHFDDSRNKTFAIQRETTPRTNPLLFDGRVLVFRRGYSKEITTGRLLLPKLDYLQASLVQRSSSALTRKLGEFEKRLEGLFLNFVSALNSSVQGAFRTFGVGFLHFPGLSTREGTSEIELENRESQAQRITIDDAEASATLSSNATRGNKVFKFTRYQALSNSFDLNNALSPFLLCDIVNNTSYAAQDDVNGVVKSGNILCQYDAETNESVKSFSLLERISIQNTVDFFTVKGRRELIRNYFKSSTLVEPAFEEVIVISKPVGKKKPKSFALNPPSWLYEAAKVFDVEDRLPIPKNKTHDDAPTIPIPIDIKVFSDVPMANIEAVLPKSKLIFRPADAVVLDLVSLVSFLAVAGSLRFDSPKLDLIALISLIVFVAQTFFRYSNKYARYDLIVNKFITSKVLHRGPGALRHIVSEANSNRALRAILTWDWLGVNAKVLDDAAVEQAKSHINAVSSTNGSQINVEVLSALDDLKDLQLIINSEVKDEQAATDAIKRRWSELLSN